MDGPGGHCAEGNKSDKGKYHVDSKINKLIETEWSFLVAGRWKEWGDVGQRVQTFSYKRNKFWKPSV